jgi:hypothetical protein
MIHNGQDFKSTRLDEQDDRFYKHDQTGISKSQYHDALGAVQEKLQAIATQLHINLPKCSIPTLRKDLRTLRAYGILADRKFRWGYYLGTGALQQEELKIALQALYSLAEYQQDPTISQLHKRVSRRLRSMDWQEGKRFYPTRVQINRVITHTDPEEMIAREYTPRILIFIIRSPQWNVPLLMVNVSKSFAVVIPMELLK